MSNLDVLVLDLSLFTFYHGLHFFLEAHIYCIIKKIEQLIGVG